MFACGKPVRLVWGRAFGHVMCYFFGGPNNMKNFTVKAALVVGFAMTFGCVEGLQAASWLQKGTSFLGNNSSSSNQQDQGQQQSGGLSSMFNSFKNQVQQGVSNQVGNLKNAATSAVSDRVDQARQRANGLVNQAQDSVANVREGITRQASGLVNQAQSAALSRVPSGILPAAGQDDQDAPQASAAPQLRPTLQRSPSAPRPALQQRQPSLPSLPSRPLTPPSSGQTGLRTLQVDPATSEQLKKDVATLTKKVAALEKQGGVQQKNLEVLNATVAELNNTLTAALGGDQGADDASSDGYGDDYGDDAYQQ
ncbi:hypothetical protein EBZ39_05410 [bacterium]|nr:hypothetical protein [bacterium]